jgi:hypothetical protein
MREGKKRNDVNTEKKTDEIEKLKNERGRESVLV